MSLSFTFLAASRACSNPALSLPASIPSSSGARAAHILRYWTRGMRPERLRVAGCCVVGMSKTLDTRCMHLRRSCSTYFIWLTQMLVHSGRAGGASTSVKSVGVRAIRSAGSSTGGGVSPRLRPKGAGRAAGSGEPPPFKCNCVWIFRTRNGTMRVPSNSTRRRLGLLRVALRTACASSVPILLSLRSTVCTVRWVPSMAIRACTAGPFSPQPRKHRVPGGPQASRTGRRASKVGPPRYVEEKSSLQTSGFTVGDAVNS
mmetsp:Transcript_15496/g.27471  ORF Transcript_15496/g.27471 Transcript_15496/m.27471 type:complete len:259 (-) Transcript_15496:193-969(-)